jgi:hypothetical protein
MFELAISTVVRFKSLAMVRVRSGGKAYLKDPVSASQPSRSVNEVAYQDQKASMNANQAKVNTRPYILMGFSPGMDRALRLTGFTTGARHKVVKSYISSRVDERTTEQKV